MEAASRIAILAKSRISSAVSADRAAQRNKVLEAGFLMHVAALLHVSQAIIQTLSAFSKY